MFTLQDSAFSLLKGRPSAFPPGAFARIGCTQYRVWAKARYSEKPVFFSFSFFIFLTIYLLGGVRSYLLHVGSLLLASL